MASEGDHITFVPRKNQIDEIEAKAFKILSSYGVENLKKTGHKFTLPSGGSITFCEQGDVLSGSRIDMVYDLE